MSLPTTSVEEALEALLDLIPPAQTQEFDIEDALGLVLAETVVSHECHPAHDTSAMDGYAVRCADLASASEDSPVVLTVMEDIRAGFPPQHQLQAGEASRISTGALIPEGCEAVVMREATSVPSEGAIAFSGPITTGANIRRAGEHLQVGEEVLQCGTLIGPPHIGMAAYLGRHSLTCFQRPRVAILATGSELVKKGAAVQKGQIRDSNSLSLAAACDLLGCEVVMRERVADSEEALDSALKRAFHSADVVITSGGISAGWHDLVKARIESLGGRFAFHKLRMRPGKPLAFGSSGSKVFFCLPGNPVSSMVTFELFAKPALERMMGKGSISRRTTAILAERIEKKVGFAIFFRGVMSCDSEGNSHVRLTGPQGSHILKSLTQANVLIATKEKDQVLEPGQLVEVIPYNLV